MNELIGRWPPASYGANVNPSSFQPPDTSRILRAGLVSSVVGLLTVIIVTLAVLRTDFEWLQVKEAFVQANPWPLLASWASMTVAFFFLGMRWRALIPPPHTPPGRGLAAILCAGLLLSSALPGPVGEFGAAWFTHKRYRVPLGMSLASSVGARIIGMIMAAVAAFICWSFASFPIPAAYATEIGIAAIVVGAAGLGLLWVIVWPQMLGGISHATFGRWSGASFAGRVFQKLHSTVVEVTEGLLQLKGTGAAAYLRCVMWSGIAHTCVLIGITIAAWSLGATPSLPGLLFTYATTTAAVIVAFAIPGSQLVWDGIFLTLLTTTAGVDLETALAITILVRVQQLSIMLAGAGTLNWLIRTTPADT